ncbi:MAG: hypothetical protein WCG80_04350, partial [Spirochaetales bacterium]
EHHDYVSVRGEGYREGEAAGLVKGEARGEERLTQERVRVAVALLAEGMSVAKVAELTGLPVATVEALAEARPN